MEERSTLHRRADSLSSIGSCSNFSDLTLEEGLREAAVAAIPHLLCSDEGSVRGHIRHCSLGSHSSQISLPSLMETPRPPMETPRPQQAMMQMTVQELDQDISLDALLLSLAEVPIRPPVPKSCPPKFTRNDAKLRQKKPLPSFARTPITGRNGTISSPRTLKRLRPRDLNVQTNLSTSKPASQSLSRPSPIVRSSSSSSQSRHRRDSVDSLPSPADLQGHFDFGSVSHDSCSELNRSSSKPDRLSRSLVSE